MIRQVIVLGGGSAGFLAAITLKVKLPDLDVTVVRSREIGVIGVGEGTTIAVPNFLHGYLDIDLGEFHQGAQPTFKLGFRFLWGPRPHFHYTFSSQTDWKWNALPKNNGYYCDDDFRYADQASALMEHDRAFVRQPGGAPLIGRNVAYHLENLKLVAYLEMKAARLGVRIVEATVREVHQDEHGVTGLRLASDQVATADLYLDCSGFASALLARALGEPFVSFRRTLFCDRAVVGGWERTNEPIKPYTTAETMDAGWCWQIEHQYHLNRGYVYASAFCDDEAAEREFRAKNPKLGATRVVPFVPGRYRNSWVKNVVAIGNASGFVEPLEATSLAAICDECRFVADLLLDSDREPTASLVQHYNLLSATAWDDIRNFLGIHFKFNTRLDTPFWRACRADVELGPAEALVDYYQANGPSTWARRNLLHANDIFGMEGYLTLLVGQQRPYEKRHRPTEAELRVWNEVRAEHRVKALGGLTVAEALAAIRSPRWTWYPGFYRQ